VGVFGGVVGGFELAELEAGADGERGGAEVLGVFSGDDGGDDDDDGGGGGGGAEDGSGLSPSTICWVAGIDSCGAPAR
jgi:hypothetical protein